MIAKDAKQNVMPEVGVQKQRLIRIRATETDENETTGQDKTSGNVKRKSIYLLSISTHVTPFSRKT